MRYVGQSYELTIPAGDGLLERFHAEHDRTYGFAAPAEPVELVSLRADERRPDRKAAARARSSRRRRARAEGAARRSTSPRPAATSTARSTTATRCRRARALAGPAVVEEFDSTTVVHPGFAVSVDDTGNLIIERETT